MVKVTAMQKVRTISDMVVAQLKQPVTASACSLLVNGKPADLDLPIRFANITPSVKLELKTGTLCICKDVTVLRLSVAGTSSEMILVTETS